MTDRRTVQIVALGLVLIALTGLVGLIWLVHEVDVGAELIAVIVAPVGTALGGLVGMLSNSGSVDPAAVAERARNEALAEVASLEPAPPVEIIGSTWDETGEIP